MAHVSVDGAIDTDFIRTSFPEHIAENYWYLHTQSGDAWTFELGLRPCMERW